MFLIAYWIVAIEISSMKPRLSAASIRWLTRRYSEAVSAMADDSATQQFANIVPSRRKMQNLCCSLANASDRHK